jgi:hypothetical protein
MLLNYRELLKKEKESSRADSKTSHTAATNGPKNKRVL